MMTNNRDKLTTLFKAIDKVFFGIEDPFDNESLPDFHEMESEEEFDVVRSIN